MKGEGNQQDYGMRVYDPRIAKFLSIDPLREEYPWYTPYQFAGNTPIQAADLDGAEEWMKQIEIGLQRKAHIKLENEEMIRWRNIGTIRPYKPTLMQRWRDWNNSKPATHTWAIFSRMLYGIGNDAKITYTTFKDGKDHAYGLDNARVTDEKERVGAGISTMIGIFTLGIGEEVNALTKLPDGVGREAFGKASALLREGVGDISNEIVVQGSRAAGTSTATSDIDFAVKVGSEKFDELISRAFGTPKEGTARWRTMQHAIKTGKITTGDAGLRGLKKQLTELLNMKVDLSIIKKGGAFDNGAQLPIKKR